MLIGKTGNKVKMLEDADLKKVGLELMFLTPEKCLRQEGISAVELAKLLDIPIEAKLMVVMYRNFPFERKCCLH